jgi:hypothetical protein
MGSERRCGVAVAWMMLPGGANGRRIIMVKRHGIGGRALLGMLLLGGTAGLARADVERIARLDDVLAVQGVESDGATVRGRIVNQTDDQLENVRLLVSDQFLWRNERHPGPESPSDVHTVIVPGPIPPHASAAFDFRRPSALPDRRDGEFVTDVSPIELTRRTPTPSGGYETTTIERTYERRRNWEGHSVEPEERLPRVIERDRQE